MPIETAGDLANLFRKNIIDNSILSPDKPFVADPSYAFWSVRTKRFTHNTLSDENIDFMRSVYEVNKLSKTGATYDEIRVQLNTIVNTYIRPGAAKQINLRNANRNAVITAFSSSNNEALQQLNDKAAREIIDMAQSDVFVRYVDSEQFETDSTDFENFTQGNGNDTGEVRERRDAVVISSDDSNPESLTVNDDINREIAETVNRERDRTTESEETREESHVDVPGESSRESDSAEHVSEGGRHRSGGISEGEHGV